MKKLRVIGSRRMLDMPVGTMFIPIECKFGYNVLKYLNSRSFNICKLINNLHIYVDSKSSASLILDPEYPDEELFFYDYHIVGDTSPENTLYIILTEDDLPEQIKTFLCGLQEPDNTYEKLQGVVKEFDEKSGWYNCYRILSKEQFLNIREKFIRENCPEQSIITDYYNNRDRQYLDDYYPGEDDQYILNMDTEIEVNNE